MFASLDNPTVLIRPSLKIKKFILTLEKCEGMPIGIQKILENKPLTKLRNSSDYKYYVTDEDRSFMDTLNLEANVNINEFDSEDYKPKMDDNLLCLNDICWLYDKLKKQTEGTMEKIYFHELFEGSQLVLPENAPIERNPELERRCKMLREQQENREYKAMTKNVDNVRQKFPEDTIAYQSKYFIFELFLGDT